MTQAQPGSRKAKLESLAKTAPLGHYLARLAKKSSSPVLSDLIAAEQVLRDATTVPAAADAVLALAGIFDGRMDEVRKALGERSVTPFSTLRGDFLEEVGLKIAQLVAKGRSSEAVVMKLGTGQGILTGLSLRYRRGHLPAQIDLALRLDREDVIVGFRRDLALRHRSLHQEVIVPDQLIPVCVVACKVYLDATRLENVQAKARSILPIYTGVSFLVLSEWDGLGKKDWHDKDGNILDALLAPVKGVVLLRGNRRPKNADLQKASQEMPILKAQVLALADAIGAAFDEWES